MTESREPGGKSASSHRVGFGRADRGVTREPQSLVRPVSLVTLQLTGEDAFAKAQKEALGWIQRRVGRRLPDDAWRGRGFALEDVGAQPAEAVSVEKEDLRLWAARLDDADKAVARRVWTTEVALGEQAGTTLLGVRLLCVTHGDDPEFERTVPGLVRQMVLPGGASLGGIPVNVEPININAEEDVDELVDLLTDVRRDVDAVVFSVPEVLGQSRDGIQLSAEHVANGALGVVHVAILSSEASYTLSDRLGREFSVFNGAVRTYRPGFDPDQDDPFDHPLALAQTVSESVARTGKEFHRVLVDYSLRRSVSRHDEENRLPSYGVIRRFADDERRHGERAVARDDKELLEIAMREIDDLQRQLERSEKESDSLLEIAESEKENAEKKAQELESKAMHLRERVTLLEKDRLSAPVEDVDAALPENLIALREWASTQLAGSVEVVNRALQAAKKSAFGDPEQVYRALMLLRDHYVPMKRGWEGATRDRFDLECRKLQLSESGAISETRAGEQGDEYFIEHLGRKRLMDRHLKKGKSRDERYCLRIYFFWDDDGDQVVVGWLPGHLDNRNT